MEEFKKTIPIEEVLSNFLIKKINEQIDRFIAGLNLANRKEIFYKVSFGEIRISANTLVINDDKLKVKIIRNIICEYYGVTFSIISVHNRKREIVLKRQVLQYFLQIYTGLIIMDIGIETGGINPPFSHATVLHSKEVINDLIECNKYFRNEIREIRLLVEKALKP